MFTPTRIQTTLLRKMYTHTHTHTHTVQNDRGEGQCCLTEIFGEEKYLEFAFEGRKPRVLGEIVPDVGAKV